MAVESALEISVSKTKGRCFIAARDILAGEVVLKSRPFASVPDSEHQFQVCAHSLNIANGDTSQWIYSAEGIEGEAAYACPKFMNKDYERYRQFEAPFYERVLYKEARHPSIFESPPKSLSLPNYANLSHYALDYTRLIIRILIDRFREWNYYGNAASRVADTELLGRSIGHAWTLCSNFASFPPERVNEFARSARVITRFVYDVLLPLVDARNREQFLRDFLPPSQELNLSSEELSLLANSNTLDGMEPLPSCDEVVGAIPIDHGSPQYQQIFNSVLELIAKEECNSFGLYTFALEGYSKPRQPYGLALFLEPVFFNHSCSPNVSHVVRPVLETDISLPVSVEMLFFAAENIKKGSELCISYVALEPPETFMQRMSGETMPGDNRRKSLKEIFFFDCDCRRCVIEQTDSKDRAVILKKWLRTLMCGQDSCHGWLVPVKATMPKLVSNQSSLSSVKASTEDFEAMDSPSLPESAQSIWQCEACSRQKTFEPTDFLTF